MPTPTLKKAAGIEESPTNALAYMFAMSSHLEERHDAIWTEIHNAVRGNGDYVVDLQDQVCQDCCPTGEN